MIQSMSRAAHCIDNGPMEGFWGILKRERYYGRSFTSKKELVQMIVVVVQIFNEFLFELFHGRELLQIEQFAFEQAKEVFSYSIVQTVAFATHTLPNALCFEQPLVQLVLVLPTLVRVEDQSCSIWNCLKSFIQHGSNHTQNRPLRDGITDQISIVQI